MSILSRPSRIASNIYLGVREVHAGILSRYQIVAINSPGDGTGKRKRDAPQILHRVLDPRESPLIVTPNQIVPNVVSRRVALSNCDSMDNEHLCRSRVLPPVRNPAPLAAAKVQRTSRKIVDSPHVSKQPRVDTQTNSNSVSWREYRADGGADREARFSRERRETSTRSSSPEERSRSEKETEREKRSERERGATTVSSREMYLAGLYVRTHPRGRRQGAGSCRGWL